MFKKLISIILSTSMLIHSAFADETQTGFYIKGGTGLNQVNPFKIRDDEYKGKIKVAHPFPMIEVGVGYNFNQGIRVEGVFDYYFLFHSHENTKDREGNIFKIESKTRAHAFMVNAYKDITTFGDLTPFVGGGIGVSTLQEKAGGHAIIDDDIHQKLDTTKSKKVHRLAYKVTLGTDYKINDSLTCELSYNYFNLGYNKPQVIDGVDNIHQRRYGIHNLLLGIRKTI